MFTKALLLGAFAAFAAAQSEVLQFTHVPNPITDGEPQAITYTTNDTQTPVTIILRKGQIGNLDTIATLTTTATGGQFIWTPPNTLPNDDDYALQIKQGSQTNYYGSFIVQGASPAAISSASASSSSTMSPSANMTMTSTTATTAGTGGVGGGVGSGLGTGTLLSRNTTMSKPTLTSDSTPTNTEATMTSASLVTFQGTATGGRGGQGGTGPTPTGAAAPNSIVSGSSALVFGALAALFYLH